VQLPLCLKKVGLVFTGTEIIYAEQNRTSWKQVSMLERVDTQMSTTSNTIECLNGHLSEESLAV
jgi:hypothetical protein